MIASYTEMLRFAASLGNVVSVTAGAMRGVPDVAADADPATGMALAVETDGGYDCRQTQARRGQHGYFLSSLCAS